MEFSTTVQIPILRALNERILERLKRKKIDKDEVPNGFLLFAELDRIEVTVEKTPLQVFEESWSALVQSNYSIEAISEFKLIYEESMAEKHKEIFLTYLIRHCLDEELPDQVYRLTYELISSINALYITSKTVDTVARRLSASPFSFAVEKFIAQLVTKDPPKFIPIRPILEAKLTDFIWKELKKSF